MTSLGDLTAKYPSSEWEVKVLFDPHISDEGKDLKKRGTEMSQDLED